ncbi:MAG: UDP-N-acetylmuramoyl-L-alanine--D-glutamate ligase [Patescibacteria group bacterium]|nr:UDP-N-acetylmuramoyl-L-alanine--D-glutamate ligase [Patescibacteria group bacterium]
MNDFKGKKTGILGLGLEGMSSAKFLLEKGAEVTILDRKEKEELDREILRFAQDDKIKFILGKDYLKNLRDYDFLVRSPGIRRNLPEMIDAEKSGTIITSQTKIFFDLCPGKIIGVTGTKGKGTTCSLIYKMLLEQGEDTYLGGNIGQPPLDFLDKLNAHSWVVLELSSFQLQDLTKSPHISVVLMMTSEHLDYHKDTKEYIDAKRNILRSQTSSDFAIINRDYPASNESDIYTEGKLFRVSRERYTNNGCFVKEGKVVIDNDSSETEIIKTEEILLPGKHNHENVCAAVMAASLAGVSKTNIVKVLKTFKGLEHRLELVSEIDRVRYYDDSFSTTPETAIAAIEAFENPEILILGGSNKNSDFTELGKVINNAKNIKAIIGIGEEWKKIKSRIQNSKFKIIEECKNMREVVVSAHLEAEPGDVVILSPACASFGMFKNYKDRGEQFKQEVKALKARAFK